MKLLARFTIFSLLIQGCFALDLSHSGLNQILNKFVKYSKYNSSFDYEGLKSSSEDLKIFNDYLDELSKVSEKEFKGLQEKDQIAFLINAYNGFTLHHMIQNWPLESIKDLDAGLFGHIGSDPWPKLMQKLRGKSVSLAAIEHEMLRRDYKEPRIHFAIVCASVGCPRLRNEAFTGEKLETQLMDQTKVFLSDSEKNRFDRKKKILFVSKIFDWFRKDFNDKFGNLKNFLLPFYTDSTEAFHKIRKEKIKIKFTNWNWNVNSPKNIH